MTDRPEWDVDDEHFAVLAGHLRRGDVLLFGMGWVEVTDVTHTWGWSSAWVGSAEPVRYPTSSLVVVHRPTEEDDGPPTV